MGGLIGALAMGAVGGAGKGISENAKADMAFNYDQMKEQMRAEMEQRIYERGRRDKAVDEKAAQDAKIGAEDRAFTRAKDLAKFERGLINSDPKGKAETEKSGYAAEKERLELIAKKYAGRTVEELTGLHKQVMQQEDDLTKINENGSQTKALEVTRARRQELEDAINAQRAALAPTSTTVSETDEFGGEAATKTSVKQKQLVDPAVKSAGQPGGVAQPKTFDEWKALPSGTRYIDPDSGQVAVKR